MRQSYLPTVSELQAFSTCARLGTTTRAAQELNLTQSAVSRSLNNLEERLGARLFNRVRQRLILSDAGRVLQRDAARLLDELNRSALTVMSFGGHERLLRLAVLPTFGSSWLIPRLASFQQTFRDVTFDVSARLTPVDFDSEALDAAVQRGTSSRPDTITHKLMTEHLVVVAAPALVGSERMLDDHELTTLPLLQQATRPSLWLDWFHHAGHDPRTILRGARFDHFDMVINAAIAGIGVAIVPELLVRDSIAAGRLVLASARRMQGLEPYALLYPSRSEAVPGFAAFRDWLLTMAAAEDERDSDLVPQQG